jgi:hypothetical protein
MTRITVTLHEDQYNLCSYLAQFFLEWETFQIKVAEKTERHFTINNFFFSFEIVSLWDNVEKFDRTGQVTDDKTAHAHCIPDT